MKTTIKTICFLILTATCCGITINRSSEQFFTKDFQWIPDKFAFRVGEVNDTFDVGLYSVAFGNNCIADGNYAMAWGNSSIASGDYSTVWGIDCNCSGVYSTVFGGLNKTTGRFNTIWGAANESTADAVTMWGQYNTTKGDDTTIAGRYVTGGANSDRSFIYGLRFDFNEPDCFALGFNLDDDEPNRADMIISRNDANFCDSTVRTRGYFKTTDSNSTQWYAAYQHSQNTTDDVHPQYVMAANLVFLAASTEQDIIIGCLVDSVDGKTPITEFADLNDVNCVIYKNDATSTEIDLTSENFAHQENGYWKLTLTADHTDTLGYLLICFRDDDVILPYSERLIIK